MVLDQESISEVLIAHGLSDKESSCKAQGEVRAVLRFEKRFTIPKVPYMGRHPYFELVLDITHLFCDQINEEMGMLPGVSQALGYALQVPSLFLILA